jgi:FkbM family methyltransferase
VNLRYIPRRARKLWQLLPDQTYRKGLKFGVAAATEHIGAMRSTPAATVIDVGANIGQFSLMTRAIHPGAIIHAFEPLRGMADVYEKLFAGDPRAVLHRCAAGASASTSELNVSKQPDSSSLLPISDRQAALFPGTEKAGEESVRIERIDDVLDVAALPEPILVKLDVQGFELEALKGMPRVLERARWVYVEVSFISLYTGQPLANEISHWLNQHGFELTGIYNTTYAQSGVNVQADLLFTRLEPPMPQG